MLKASKHSIALGIKRLLSDELGQLKGQRVGLICNQASVDHGFRHAADLFFVNPAINLTTLFGPQHGIRGDVQDNMIETGHSTDPTTGLPIYSLYSETRIPTAEMMADVDVIVYDLQDIGGRVYTFIYTMANAMIACAKYGKKMIVCDRPNPIGGTAIEGNVLENGHESFVGQYPIPMRHSMTAGELALLFNKEYGINCDLEVIKMEGWKREYYLDETDSPWVLPSPNMPTVEAAVVFPGTVFFEGTQVSEGRGTTKPFELIGAPYISSKTYTDALNALDLPGVIFRSAEFIPTFQKHAGKVCGGSQLHITNRNIFEPVITGLAMVKTAFDMYPDDFKWKEPPYEYEFERNPFDVIAGSTKIRQAFEQGISLAELKTSWQIEVDNFAAIRQQYLLY
jgi:uncharacterized protein YbbC (DUF1343 family)